MVMRERWFIREGTDIKEFAKALKACKEFTPEKQRLLLRMIMDCKLDKIVSPGVKKRRVRKKIIKKEIEQMKEDLAFRMLDMMERKTIDIPKEEVDCRVKQKEAFDALIKYADEPPEEKKISERLKDHL